MLALIEIPHQRRACIHWYADEAALILAAENLDHGFADAAENAAHDLADDWASYLLIRTVADLRAVENYHSHQAHTVHGFLPELKAMIRESLDPFTMAYLECALWSTTDESNEQGGDPLDENYGPEDIAIETLESMIVDCKRFQEENATDIAAGPDSPDYTVWERAGHDFLLTRNGHGAGFWDGDWPEEVGERLTEASEAFGEMYLYVGDDGLIWS